MKIAITGPGRSGTQWLAATLAGACPEFLVEHEPFTQAGLPGAATRWLARAGRHFDWIMVSHYARDAMPEIEREVDRWVFLWRCPLDVLRSYLIRRTFSSQFGGDVALGTRLRVLARQQYGDLAASLGWLAARKIAPLHVLFEQACDPGPEGLSALLRDLGIGRPVDAGAFPPPMNATPGELVVDGESFSAVDRSFVRDIWHGLPIVRDAVAQAADRFAAVYGRDPPDWTRS